MYLISQGREFQAEGAAYEHELFPNVLVRTCGIRRVFESEEERRCLDGEYIHEEGQISLCLGLIKDPVHAQPLNKTTDSHP